MVVAAIWGVGGHREVEKAIWGGFCDGWSWFWEVVDDALIYGYMFVCFLSVSIVCVSLQYMGPTSPFQGIRRPRFTCFLFD
jgi:hypothetical protein